MARTITEFYITGNQLQSTEAMKEKQFESLSRSHCNCNLL
jgi:hypothetical protein